MKTRQKAMYNGFKDYYQVLKISFPATEADIKNAYRQLAKAYHPDLHPDDNESFTEKFREVTEAYEHLSDPLKKENYDFLYRRVVLQEFPKEDYYYPETYYEDPTPPDETVYTHKYTVNRKRGNVNVTGILVGILLVLQVGALIIKAAPVGDPDRTRNASFPVEMFREHRPQAPLQKDTASILFINRRPAPIR